MVGYNYQIIPVSQSFMANSIGFRFYSAFAVASGVRVPGVAKTGRAVDSGPAGPDS